jgi:hypothetical protein
VPVVLNSPINNARPADPNAVVFSWATSEGADAYILQISRDTLFRPENTVTIDAFQGNAPGGTSKTNTVDATSNFPGAGDQVLRWRIGARYTRDQAPPRLQPGVNRPQDQGWVWSVPNSFVINVLPAPERGFVRPKRASHGR